MAKSALGECLEHKIIRENLTNITQSISYYPDGPTWFAQKLEEKAFIPNATSAVVLGFSNYQHTSKLIEAVKGKISASQEPGKEFAQFLEILLSNPPLEDLAMKLRNEYYGIEQPTQQSLLNPTQPCPSYGPTAYPSQYGCYYGSQFIPMAHDLPHHPNTPRVPPLPPHVPAQPLHAIPQYAQYLKSYYQSKKLPTCSKGPHTAFTQYIHLAVVKKRSKQEADKFTKPTLHGNIDDIIQVMEPLDISRVGVKEDQSPARFILVEGAPGIGKTTFAWKVSRKWSKGKILHGYRLVVLLELRDKCIQKAKTIRDLLSYSDVDLCTDVAKEIERMNGESVLLLYDGYDELPAALQTQKSIFLKILNRECLPKATVLITSRPCATEFLSKFKAMIDQHIEILGFMKADIQSYIESAVQDKELREELSQYLKFYPNIHSVMYIPLNAVIVTETYKEAKLDGSQELIPTTLTEVYTSLSRGMVLRYLNSHDNYSKRKWKFNSFSDLPDKLHKQFHKICEVAFQHILKGETNFDDLPSDFNILGLMQSAPELYVHKETVVSHNFFHLTLQEFLAAVHVSEQPTEKQLQYFKQSVEQLDPPTWKLPTLTENMPLDKPNVERLDAHLSAILQPRQDPLQVSTMSHPTSEIISPGQESPEAHISKQLEVLVSQLLRPQPLMVNPQLEVPTRHGVSPLEKTQPNRALTQNVLRFTAGLTKFRDIPVDSLRPILLQYKGWGDRQVITLNALHWLFEGECSSDTIRETTKLTFDYMGRNMSPFDCFVLGFAMSYFKCEWNINLCLTRIGDDGLEMLVAGMSFRKATLTSSIQQVCLNLADCDISSVGLSHLKEMPKDVATRITELNLNGNNGEGVTGLLRKLTNLTTLYLPCTTLSPQEVDLLAELLSHTEYLQNLEHLDLRSSLNSTDSTSHILHALCYNTTLRVLVLLEAHISTDNISLLTSALRTNTTLRQLHLESCNISGNSCCEISSALCNNSTLEILNLSSNTIGLSGATALADMLKGNKTLLRELHLESCNISGNSCCEISGALCNNSTLEILNLSSNTIGASALADMLKGNEILRKRIILDTSIGEDGTLKLNQSLEHNSTPKQLCVDHD